eukprot:COSAG02_NODE_12886_length_1476_cov_2.088598_1_plen_58_part_10
MCGRRVTDRDRGGTAGLLARAPARHVHPVTLCWATREAPDDSSAEKRAPTSRREILRS